MLLPRKVGAYYWVMDNIVLPNIHLWYKHQWSIDERKTRTKQTKHTQKERSCGDAINYYSALDCQTSDKSKEWYQSQKLFWRKKVLETGSS